MLVWEDLKYVLAMSRHKSATAAGKALRVNATTVTRRITTLEENLEVALFVRTPDGTECTVAGASAVRAAVSIEQEILRLDAQVHGLDHEVQGSLRVTSTEMLFDFWQTDLASFRAKHPKLRLALASSPHKSNLARREADVALRLTVMPPEQLVGRRHAEVFFAVYASPALIAEQGKHASPYRAYPWIGWDNPFAEPTDRVIDAVAKGAETVLRISTMNQLLRAVESGEGISVLPCFLGDTSAHLQRLGSYFEGGTYLWALTHERLRRTGRVRAFMDLVSDLVERDAELWCGKRPRLPTAPTS